jgi:hypothetical protein
MLKFKLQFISLSSQNSRGYGFKENVGMQMIL